MKSNEVLQVVKEVIRHPESPALFLWGGPGVGKSSVIRQASREEEVDCIDIRLLLLDPTDLRGIPVPTEDGKAKWLAPSFLPTEGKGVVFFDELNTAPPLTQNSALQFVLDRKLGEYSLPPGWCVISAGNREMEGFVHRISPPLLNRFIHIDFDVDVDEWVTWALRNSVASEVIAFLAKFRPELLYKFDSHKRAFPTPRSWEFVGKTLKNDYPEEVKQELITGTVGEGAAGEFRAYLNIWAELPDLRRILDKGENIIPKKIDLKYATITGLVGLATEDKHYTRLIDYALALEREYTVFLLKMLLKKDRERLTKAPNWGSTTKKLVVDEELLV